MTTADKLAGEGRVEPGAVLQPNGLDVRAVDPRNGEKYSPNLHRWLAMRSKKHHAWTSRVYRDQGGTLWIGMLDLGDLIGARLMNVLCYGAKAESFCYVGMRGLLEVTDFWPRYMAEGRCAIDPEHKRHFVGDDTRWTVGGDTRACLWCGKAQQVLARWTEAVERQEWRGLQHKRCDFTLAQAALAEHDSPQSSPQSGGDSAHPTESAGSITDAAERDAAIESMHSALRLVADLRWALGDEGGRMQDELIEYAKQLRNDAERYRWLRDNPWPPILATDFMLHRNARWDAEIDAARAEQPEAAGEDGGAA